MPVQTNKYASVDEIISGEEMQFPFVVTKFLDIIRNDGQGSAQIILDEGSPIPARARGLHRPMVRLLMLNNLHQMPNRRQNVQGKGSRIVRGD